jgi:hypothetical protein
MNVHRNWVGGISPGWQSEVGRQRRCGKRGGAARYQRIIVVYSARGPRMDELRRGSAAYKLTRDFQNVRRRTVASSPDSSNASVSGSGTAAPPVTSQLP